ncbi:MAG: hypothetical protein WCD37_10735, partial [Chloroflexia bacterium]
MIAMASHLVWRCFGTARDRTWRIMALLLVGCGLSLALASPGDASAAIQAAAPQDAGPYGLDAVILLDQSIVQHKLDEGTVRLTALNYVYNFLSSTSYDASGNSLKHRVALVELKETIEPSTWQLSE